MRVFLMGATPSFDIKNSMSAQDRLQKTGGNVGNQIIAYGLLKTIRYESISWDFSVGPEYVNQHFDVIVIAAANFLHSGFDFSGMADFIERTQLPVVMIGLGAQSKDYNPKIDLLPGTIRLVQIASERSALIGVRGVFTADVLSHLGIKNVQITGCPSYYMAGSKGLEIETPLISPKTRIAFNSSRDVIRHAFDAVRMKSSVFDIMKECLFLNADFVIQSELDEISISEIHSTNNDQDDVGSGFIDFYSEKFDKEKLRLWATNHLKVYWDVEEWLSAMKNFDFIVGHRFHGSMAALQAGTPACVICHDSRTTEMCEFLGMPHISLADSEKLNISELANMVDPNSIRSRYSELRPKYIDFLQSNKLVPSS